MIKRMRAVMYPCRVRMLTRFFSRQDRCAIPVSASRCRRQQGAAPQAGSECSWGSEDIMMRSVGRRLRGSVVFMFQLRGRPYWRVLQ